MTKLSQLELEKFLLRRLLAARCIGSAQMVYDNIAKWVPKSDRGDAKDALDSLIRKGFLLTKRKHYGVHVSINPEMVPEVRRILLENQ